MTGGVSTLSECPEEKIREIQEQHPEICVNAQKQNLKGQFSNLPQQYCAITDLIDGTLVARLREESGGGTYRIDPRDLETRQLHIVPPYYVSVTGPAVATGTMVDAVARPAARPVYAVPTHAEQARAERAAAIEPNTVWERSPDAIASQVAEDYKAQAAALRAEMRTYADKTSRTIDTLKQQLDAEKRDKEKKEHESQLNLLRQEMKAFADRPVAAPVKPTLDGTAIVGLVTAAGGILAAILTSGAERQRLAAERQSQAEDRRRAAEQQQFQLILGLMKKDDKGNNATVDILKVLAPVLAPLLPKLLEGRDPTKAAELLSSMAENQMSMLSMVATSMQSMMGEPENPMMAMLRDTIGGVITAASKASEIAQQQNPARHVPGVPANRPMTAQATQPQQEHAAEVVSAAPVNTQPATVATPPKNGRPMTAPQYAAMLMQHPEWPDDMKHPEWKTILIEMHGTAPAESVGVTVAHKLEEMFRRNVLREDIALIFTDDSDQSRSVFLRHIFDTFPVAQDNPERYAGILHGIDGEIGDDDGQDAEDETSEKQAQPEVDA